MRERAGVTRALVATVKIAALGIGAAAGLLVAPFVSTAVGATRDTAKGYASTSIRASKFGYRHPWLMLGTLGLAGAALYAGCAHRDAIKERGAAFARTAFETTMSSPYRLQAFTLERALEEKQRELAATQEDRARTHAYAGTLEERAQEYARVIAEHETRYNALRTENAALRDAQARRVETQRADGQRDTAPHHDARTPEPAWMAAEGYNFYYVRPGETLSGIASAIAGDPTMYTQIQRDNGITDPRAMPAGTLLRVRTSMCTLRNDRVYTRVLALKQTLLSPGEKVSDAFPDTWRSVLALNEKLGLRYTDDMPRGERIVYSER